MARADTVIVPGIDNLERTISPAIFRALRSASERGARIASICTGAFVLARAGLLDGLRATTHWRAAAELARRFPRTEVDADVLYVDNGRVLTSAGAAAGMDLCLHIVRRDYGASVAAHVARAAVMPLERSGGQAQFIEYEPPDASDSMGSLLVWMERNLKQSLSLSIIASHARMSTRTLSRRFHEHVGLSPAQWLAKARIRRAQHLLETTGFLSSTSRLRRDSDPRLCSENISEAQLVFLLAPGGDPSRHPYSSYQSNRLNSIDA